MYVDRNNIRSLSLLFADILFLSVKPQYLMEVLDEMNDLFRTAQIIVSIVAGISLSQISDVIGDWKICRVMPNTPCLVSEGWSINDCSDAGRKRNLKREKQTQTKR